jgi:hypothetical protein
MSLVVDLIRQQFRREVRDDTATFVNSRAQTGEAPDNAQAQSDHRHRLPW